MTDDNTALSDILARRAFYTNEDTRSRMGLQLGPIDLSTRGTALRSIARSIVPDALLPQEHPSGGVLPPPGVSGDVAAGAPTGTGSDSPGSGSPLLAGASTRVSPRDPAEGLGSGTPSEIQALERLRGVAGSLGPVIPGVDPAQAEKQAGARVAQNAPPRVGNGFVGGLRSMLNNTKQADQSLPDLLLRPASAGGHAEKRAYNSQNGATASPPGFERFTNDVGRSMPDHFPTANYVADEAGTIPANMRGRFDAAEASLDANWARMNDPSQLRFRSTQLQEMPGLLGALLGSNFNADNANVHGYVPILPGTQTVSTDPWTGTHEFRHAEQTRANKKLRFSPLDTSMRMSSIDMERDANQFLLDQFANADDESRRLAQGVAQLSGTSYESHVSPLAQGVQATGDTLRPDGSRYSDIELEARNLGRTHAALGQEYGANGAAAAEDYARRMSGSANPSVRQAWELYTSGGAADHSPEAIAHAEGVARRFTRNNLLKSMGIHGGIGAGVGAGAANLGARAARAMGYQVSSDDREEATLVGAGVGGVGLGAAPAINRAWVTRQLGKGGYSDYVDESMASRMLRSFGKLSSAEEPPRAPRYQPLYTRMDEITNSLAARPQYQDVEAWGRSGVPQGSEGAHRSFQEAEQMLAAEQERIGVKGLTRIRNTELDASTHPGAARGRDSELGKRNYFSPSTSGQPFMVSTDPWTGMHEMRHVEQDKVNKALRFSPLDGALQLPRIDKERDANQFLVDRFARLEHQKPYALGVASASAQNYEMHDSPVARAARESDILDKANWRQRDAFDVERAWSGMLNHYGDNSSALADYYAEHMGGAVDPVSGLRGGGVAEQAWETAMDRNARVGIPDEVFARSRAMPGDYAKSMLRRSMGIHGALGGVAGAALGGVGAGVANLAGGDLSDAETAGVVGGGAALGGLGLGAAPAVNRALVLRKIRNGGYSDLVDASLGKRLLGAFGKLSGAEVDAVQEAVKAAAFALAKPLSQVKPPMAPPPLKMPAFPKPGSLSGSATTMAPGGSGTPLKPPSGLKAYAPVLSGSQSASAAATVAPKTAAGFGGRVKLPARTFSVGSGVPTPGLAVPRGPEMRHPGQQGGMDPMGALKDFMRQQTAPKMKAAAWEAYL